MPIGRGRGYAANTDTNRMAEPKKDRFSSTKRMINDDEGMGKLLKHGGMFIVLIVWNVLEAFTYFIPSAIWVFIISGLLDALVNCLVIIFSSKLKGKNAWIWAAIISGWNVMSLLSHMLPTNLWILIDIILDVVVNLLFLMFAQMVNFDKESVPAVPAGTTTGKPEEKPDSGMGRTISQNQRSAAAVSRPASETNTTKEIEPSAVEPAAGSVSENPLENDTLKMMADLTHTNRILAEQLQQKQGGEANDRLAGKKDGT